MSLQFFMLKFDPLRNWMLKGIPRGIYPIYLMWKKENSEITEKELAIALFNRRFSTKPLLNAKQEEARIKRYFEEKPEPENLVDTCIASAIIEFQVPLENRKTCRFIEETMSIELFKLGYRWNK